MQRADEEAHGAGVVQARRWATPAALAEAGRKEEARGGSCEGVGGGGRRRRASGTHGNAAGAAEVLGHGHGAAAQANPPLPHRGAANRRRAELAAFVPRTPRALPALLQGSGDDKAAEDDIKRRAQASVNDHTAQGLSSDFEGLDQGHWS